MDFPRERPNIPALTGLRGVAAAWVALFHLTVGVPILRHGDLGVDVFFILSGYVLTYVYAGKLANSAAYFGFIRARLARIYPLHLVTLCVLALMVVALPDLQSATPCRMSVGGSGPFSRPCSLFRTGDISCPRLGTRHPGR
jgi:peptidoglycan/LPS O-acetylase OafA/YrhL